MIQRIERLFLARSLGFIQLRYVWFIDAMQDEDGLHDLPWPRHGQQFSWRGSSGFEGGDGASTGAGAVGDASGFCGAAVGMGPAT